MARPGYSKASPQDPCYMEEHTIDDQVGFYSQDKQPHLGDVNSRVGQTPAAPDERFGDNVAGDMKK